jgi:predicted phage terminase large subunit-like protein
MTRTERIGQYAEIIQAADAHGGIKAVDLACRELCKTDLFYLLAYALNRKDVRDYDWLFDRCREVQANPDGYLDLWAREHYKSTIVTFAKTIQDILNDQEITIGIFSHTKPIARAFLRQIKYELETNTFLQRLFPEVLYSDPKKEAPAVGNAWSEDKGITVKRSSNPKEATIEAHGLVDGQPTSKHYALLIYDDVVTLESVSSPEMIQKTTDALALSYNLGAHGGRRRFIGTRYHFSDTYREIMKRGTAAPRVYPATDDGTVNGKPVFLSPEANAEKRRDMGHYVYGCQMLQNPTSESQQSFDLSWLRYYSVEPDQHDLNIYIVVDPAHSKKKSSDYTVILVIGLGADRNYYLIDGIRKRLSLSERTDELFRLHREYIPQSVGYEQYGIQADIEHIQEAMERKNYRFSITPLGGRVSKEERIKRLQPKFEQGRIWLPKFLWQTNTEGKRENIIATFIDEEYQPFPVCVHDDMLDDMANILHPDMPAHFPTVARRPVKESWRDKTLRSAHRGASAQAA